MVITLQNIRYLLTSKWKPNFFTVGSKYIDRLTPLGGACMNPDLNRV